MLADMFEAFLAATTPQRLRMAKDPQYAADLRQHLGAAAHDEYVQLAGTLDEAHLGAACLPNLIFVPGVMGSLLKSDTRGGIWWIDVRTRAMIDHLRLSTDGTQDADPQDRVVPCTTDFDYDPFLSAVLTRDDFGHRTFPYDWRKPLHLSAPKLRDLVLQTYEENEHKPVHLVAHSMGGLMGARRSWSTGRSFGPSWEKSSFSAPHIMVRRPSRAT